MARPRARLQEFSDPNGAAHLRACDHAGCAAAGEYRAPRSRTSLNEYYWFCLEHVRAYNAAWDYYKGMSPEEIEAQRRSDMVGWRPTWPMGSRRRHEHIDEDQLRAAFHRMFDEDILGGGAEKPSSRARAWTPEDEALAVMDLSHGATFEEVRARYKELVKRHHPDANGGDKTAEERLKSINQAYTYLKTQASNARNA
jgi:hypothetical protein